MADVKYASVTHEDVVFFMRMVILIDIFWDPYVHSKALRFPSVLHICENTIDIFVLSRRLICCDLFFGMEITSELLSIPDDPKKKGELRTWSFFFKCDYFLMLFPMNVIFLHKLVQYYECLVSTVGTDGLVL